MPSEEKQRGAEGCLFCEAGGSGPGLGAGEEELLVFRGEHAFVVVNKYPYNSGHVMVAPFLHTADFVRLSVAVRNNLMELVQKTIGVLETVYQPHGVNVGLNLGAAAGAGIPEHMHIHIVPRWNGDSNFMPVTAGVKVLPEAPTETCVRLRAAFAAATNLAVSK